MATTTEVAIYNKALSLVGSTVTVASTSESTTEAETCLLWYDDVRDTVLHAAPWPSCQAVKRLSLLYERDTSQDWEDYDPVPGYRFMFPVPDDMLRPWHLSTFERFQIGVDQSNNKRLYTNREDAILHYSKQQTTITTWDHELLMAVIHGLAAYISMPLNGRPGTAEYNLALANAKIMDARMQAANSQETQLETLPEWITARGFDSYAPGVRYVYPAGPLLTLTSAPVT